MGLFRHPTNLLICPRCHQFYSSESKPSSTHCHECNCTLDLVYYEYERYAQLSDDEKTAFKKQYIENHYPTPYHEPFTPMPQSGWVSFIGYCGWLTVLSLVIAGIVTCMTGAFGAGLCLMIAAPASGGALILFSIVAEDVRHIRNQVDKLRHDQKYKQ